MRRAPERSPEPPRTADFHAPSPEPHFPGIFSLASEPNGAACEVHLLQEEEFAEAEADVPDEPPDLAENVLRPRHPSHRRLPARVMFASKESGHHGMDALDYRTPSVPEEISEHPPVIVLGDASQSRGHLARGVELPPCAVGAAIQFVRVLDSHLNRDVSRIDSGRFPIFETGGYASDVKQAASQRLLHLHHTGTRFSSFSGLRE